MGFYQMAPPEREELVRKIHGDLVSDLTMNQSSWIVPYFSNPDTYIRKASYLAIGRIYTYYVDLREKIMFRLDELSHESDFKIRQTAINAAGEIGKQDFERVRFFFDRGLFDEHHSPRNAVIGSIKKMGEVNPVPVLNWAKTYLHHPEKEIRREICHGIELRGRTHPQDILPLLRELEFDQTARVTNTLVHVIGQIAYKKGCLERVLEDLKHWKNKTVVEKALLEIIDVHHRYRNFSFYTQEEALKVIGSFGDYC